MEKRKTLSEQAGSSQSDLGHTAILTLLIWDTYAATYGMVGSKPGLLPRTISGSVVFMQTGPVFDVHCSWYHQRPHGCPGSGPPPVAMLLSGDHAAIKAVTI